MAGMSTMSQEYLIRSQLWSKQIKQLLMDDLMAQRFVRIISDFPDGTVINIPSIGEASTSDFAEGQAIKYESLDTGNFQFSFDQYKYSAHSITEKFKRDSYYASDVISAFPQREHRALMEAVETRIFDRANAGQTASNLNVINGANHRWVANGTSETLSLDDFRWAQYALQKANVPMTNLVAVIDPSSAMSIQNQANVGNLLTPAPEWQQIVHTGLVTGMRFKSNLYGFDVYVSNYLPQNIAETIDGKSTTVGTTNLFFSAQTGDVAPIIGGFRQMPTVYSEFNKDLQQDEHLTICEYGFKLYRPENMVIVLSDTDQVYA